MLMTQAISLTSAAFTIAAGTISYLTSDLTTSSSINDNLPTYSLSEVAEHDSCNDCWMIIYEKVYDLGKFVHKHPGGDVLLEHAGRDATLAFRSVGHSHSEIKVLEKYCIGLLAENEIMYSRNNSLFG